MLPKWCGQSQYVDASLLSANNFFVFFINIKTPLTPHKIYKKLESKKHHTPKDKNMCFKIQGYFGNLTMLKNRKNQKNPSPKAKDIQTPHQF